MLSAGQEAQTEFLAPSVSPSRCRHEEGVRSKLADANTLSVHLQSVSLSPTLLPLDK